MLSIYGRCPLTFDGAQIGPIKLRSGKWVQSGLQEGMLARKYTIYVQTHRQIY